MTSFNGFKNIEIIYLICLYFYFLWIKYDLSHVICLPMYGFPEPGLVTIIFKGNLLFVNMDILI